MPRRSLPILLLLLALPACGGNGDGGMEPPPPDPPLVNTPNDLIEALRIAWDARDHTQLDPLLADDFRFFLSPNDVSFWGVPAEWGLVEEIACTRNAFTGQSGTRPGGAFQPPVDARFAFGLVMNPVEVQWEVTKRLDQPFAGALSRRYDQTMLVQYTSFDFDFVGSRQEFFVVEETFTQSDGSEARRYVLRAWMDLGIPNPDFRHGNWSWGYFKTIFQDPLP